MHTSVGEVLTIEKNSRTLVATMQIKSSLIYPCYDMTVFFRVLGHVETLVN